VADYAYVLETGAVVTAGPSVELASDARTSEIDLGAARDAYRDEKITL
jgi:hypothetical protein